MSILIKGMEMPTDGVYWCEIGVAGDIATITIHGEDRRTYNLIPVPPHGRLVDADDVNNHIHGWVDLRGCPTIIPAEEAAVKDMDVLSKPYDLLHEEGGLGIR